MHFGRHQKNLLTGCTSMLAVEWLVQRRAHDQTATQIAEFLLHKTLTGMCVTLAPDQEPICNALCVHG